MVTMEPIVGCFVVGGEFVNLAFASADDDDDDDDEEDANDDAVMNRQDSIDFEANEG